MLMSTFVTSIVLALVSFVQAAPHYAHYDARDIIALAPRATTSVTSPGSVPVATNAAVVAAGLKTQPSENDKMKKLLLDSSGNLLTGEALRDITVFDYSNQKPATGANGGSILLATVDNWAFLQGQGISNAISFVGPCGLNIPHFHPRASEILTVIDGQLNAGTVLENGFNTEIHAQLGKYQATLFPQGSLHYQYNPTCKNATFVAALGSEDPGRSDIATNFWMLDSDVVNAALGFPETIDGSNIADWKSKLPVNLAYGIESCLKACDIDNGDGDDDDDDDDDDDRVASATASASAKATASAAAASVSTSATAKRSLFRFF